MDVFKTHGAFSWNELMTSDPAAAGGFYGSLFGWGVQTMDMGTGPYRVVKIGDTAMGGIMGMPPGAPGMPPTWACYVTVQDLDATVARCNELGGKVVAPVMDIPQVGRIAVISDPQGAVLNLIQYSSAG